MKKVVALITLSILLHGCGGGGGGGSDNGSGSGNGKLTLAVADALVDNIDSVVLTVDKVILRRDGASDIVIDRFTIPALGITDADTFQIDLLNYRNGNRLLMVDGLVVPAGNYSQLILQVLDNDVNYSYVDTMGHRVPIKQPSEQLKLGGFSVNASGVYAYTLDFDLRKAMTYNPGPDRYILKPRGVRVVSEQLASTLQGRVDTTILNLDPGCMNKADPLAGNVVYLYQNHNLGGALVDVYDPDIASGVPAGVVNPYASATVFRASDNSWRYHFGYLPAGDYTLAFACHAENDHGDTYDHVAIPQPGTQRAELTLTAGQQSVCNLPIADGHCEF
jgi:hypothetical protein